MRWPKALLVEKNATTQRNDNQMWEHTQCSLTSLLTLVFSWSNKNLCCTKSPVAAGLKSGSWQQEVAQLLLASKRQQVSVSNLRKSQFVGKSSAKRRFLLCVCVNFEITSQWHL